MTVMRRPILLRVEGSPPSSRLEAVASFECFVPLDRISAVVPSPTDGERGAPIRALAVACSTTSVVETIPLVFAALGHASALGASLLNVTLPPVGEDGCGFAGYQEGLNYTHALLHELRFEAEAAGVALAIEAPSDGCLLSPVELRELIDAANSPMVGVCLHVERIEPLGSPVDWARTLHRRVHAVRWSKAEGSDPAVLAAGLEHLPSDRPLIVHELRDVPRIRSLCDAQSRGIRDTAGGD